MTFGEQLAGLGIRIGPEPIPEPEPEPEPEPLVPTFWERESQLRALSVARLFALHPVSTLAVLPAAVRRALLTLGAANTAVARTALSGCARCGAQPKPGGETTDAPRSFCQNVAR